MHAGSDAAGVGREITAHRVDIVNDGSSMLEQAFARRGQFDAAAAAFQKGDAEGCFQTFDPRAGGSQRQMGAQRTTGDTARLSYGDKQLEVNQIETHGDFRFHLPSS